VVVINQDEPGETTGTTPPPEPKHKTGGLPRHPHKVTKAQARELLSHGNDVYQIDRGGAYVPITKLAGVHVQLYTGEKGWAFLQEPDKGKLPGGKVGKVPTGKSHKVTRPKAA
jgi:hypothetical protein